MGLKKVVVVVEEVVGELSATRSLVGTESELTDLEILKRSAG
jgi:hypothetical protein